jgi:hypothetical protein
MIKSTIRFILNQNSGRFHQSGMNILCSFSLLAQRKEPKERAPCHSVFRTFLRFSKGPALEETRFAQTVHERNPNLSAMLDLVTMGQKKDLRKFAVILCALGGLP